MAIRIGTSGWRYAEWRGAFYPPGLPRQEELHLAAQRLDSIEINGSLYALRSPARYAAPEDFVLSIKAPRFIAHVRRLHQVAKPLANVLALRPRDTGPALAAPGAAA